MVQIAGCGERWSRVDVAGSSEWSEAVRATIEACQLIVERNRSLTWLDEACALCAGSSPEGSPGIRIGGFTLVIFDRHEQPFKTMPLGGASRTDVISWLASHGIGGVKSDGQDAPLPTPEHRALSNLERTISNAHTTLGYIARRTHGADPVLTHAETLETSFCIRLATRAGEVQRTITAGLSPNGEQGALFVRAEPGQSVASLAMSEVAARTDGDTQTQMVESFLHRSLSDAYLALRREWKARPSAPAGELLGQID